jgi:hypothetical protein
MAHKNVSRSRTAGAQANEDVTTANMEGKPQKRDNASRSRTVGAQANEDVTTTIMEGKPQKRDKALELRLSQFRVLEILRDDWLHSYHYSR